jgi:predicted O-methyltransferase YrrM
MAQTNLEKILRRSIGHTKTLLFGQSEPRPVPALEPVYQRLFERDLEALKIENRYYAVGAAANYGLLYVIIRALKELRFTTIVELGAGQSTFLFDALARAGQTNARILTIEHDQSWAGHMASRVKHPVEVVQLVEKRVGKHVVLGYDLTDALEVEAIDFLLIDGPPNYPPPNRNSRLGALELIKRINKRDFLIVVDDAERAGERLLSTAIHSELDRQGLSFRKGSVVSNKRQDIFAGGNYISAAFY